MANEKNKSEEHQSRQKPNSNVSSQPMPKRYSNEANHKGAVDLGTDGTKATASQQQGQGAWNAKNASDQRKQNKED
ncbi:hypothetical protein H9Q13_12375 [Pontibacter sp. JH31]|uniref:Uncharacterized protein n=2 Tax=Pontibacter aquaedesilientis TaxID=2766980 RepID=A0ABR7XI48_9BACT|nr:hypothetical protein [Pontibacter aquaedesilientis]